MSTTMTSREFNQDTGGAKKAAERGPVIITDRGRPSHVLLTFDAFQRLMGVQVDFLELMGSPEGVEAIAFEAPRSRATARPAELD